MAGWQWSSVLALGVCCFVALPLVCQSAEGVVANVSDLVFNNLVVFAKPLPLTRPGQGSGYNFCTLSACASSVTVRARNGAAPDHNLKHGVLYLELKYKPIRGVNSTMMTWMFANMGGKAVYAPTKEVFDMYLLFHPRDHGAYEVHNAGGVNMISEGSQLAWFEMILSNCNYDGNHPTEPWACPSTAKGFVQSDPKEAWAAKYKSSDVVGAAWSNSTGMQFSMRATSHLLSWKGGLVATVRHTWADNKAGTALINMTTKLWIGLVTNGRADRFNTTEVADLINGEISRQLMEGTSDLSSQNATALGYMYALHFVEEFGGTKDWLPAVWRARK